ncbi:hypothetical protein [Nocardia sp. NPDC049707]|uniref:hypothetical protein n=1 Tax=Nocardia sp. NPDC049707 TaxID=3154735 RepID=UPI00343C7D00
MIFVMAGRPGLVVADDFNRADAANLGTNYTILGSSPVIASGRAQGGTPTIGQAIAYAARNNTPLSSDGQEIAFTLATATTGSSPGLGGGCFLRSTAGGDRVEAAITDSLAVISTRIGGTATTRASVAISSPTTARLTAAGTLYSLYINGATTPTVTWTDTGSIIGIGASTRYFGLTVAANTDFASVTTRAYAIDGYVARDL